MEAIKINAARLIFLLAVLVFSSFYSGEKRESLRREDPPSICSGGLVVYVRTPDFRPVHEARLVLSRSMGRPDGVFIQRITTTSGKADFGQLRPGLYFYRVEVYIGNKLHLVNGTTRVIACRNSRIQVLVGK